MNCSSKIKINKLEERTSVFKPVARSPQQEVERRQEFSKLHAKVKILLLGT